MPLNPPEGLAAPPPAQDPPTVEDVAGIDRYCSSLRGRRGDQPTTVTDQQVADGVCLHLRVTASSLGWDVERLAGNVAQLEERLDQVQQQVPAGHGPLPGGLQQNQQAPQQLEALQQNQQAPLQLQGLHQMLQELQQTMEQQLQGLQQTMQGLQQTMQGVENRLEGVGNRLEGVENRLEGVGNRLEGVENRLEGVENRLEGVGNRLEGVENRLEGVGNRLEGVEGEVRKLGHRTSPKLRQALQHNAHSFTTTSQLAVVPHPDTGEEPEDFPATNGDLAQMPYAGLRRLLRFYGQPIIGTTDMLRQRLKAFIGQAP